MLLEEENKVTNAIALSDIRELERRDMPGKSSRKSTIRYRFCQIPGFKKVKQAILKRYSVNEEKFRQRFTSTKKKRKESYAKTDEVRTIKRSFK